MILHIISGDKFTIGYIKFMVGKMGGSARHHFIVYKPNSNFDASDTDLKGVDYVTVRRNRDLLFSHTCREEMRQADKIVVSGIFGGIDKALALFPKRIIKKTYLHFWGGDFYSYRGAKMCSKKWIRGKVLYRCIKRCGGVINLIPGDYDELSRIFPNRTAHYVASMPNDPTKKMDYSKYYRWPGGHRVLLGNSATIENCHMEALDMLAHLADDNIEIICPLSYGDKLYAGKVIEKGRVIFGDNFMPITDYMPKDQYLDLISSCAVAIFNNNRQQAMGNINMLLEMGRKIYMRENTSMWDCYRSFDIVINPASSLAKINKEELFKFDEKIAESNRKNVARKNNEYDNNWSIILNI